jgi:hypothetical protein
VQSLGDRFGVGRSVGVVRGLEEYQETVRAYVADAILLTLILRQPSRDLAHYFISGGMPK